jgi:endo-1,4-beta-xylanase
MILLSTGGLSMKQFTSGLLFAVLATSLISVSCEKKPQTLAEAYKDHFFIGAAVTAGDYMSQPFFKSYDKEVLDNFNMFVLENGMKPEAIYSRNGVASYNFKYGDLVYDYAQKNGAVMRGHCIIWHNQTPGVLMKAQEGREASRTSMEEYITGYVGHYKGKVAFWDVVNEAISDNPMETYRTGSGWYIAYGGPEYIADAFTFSRAADPEAKLYYNDYNVCEPGKRERIVTMINELGLIEKGIIDGIGIQAHWGLSWPPVELIEETINTFADMGLDVQFTELDIDCYDGDTQAPEMPYSPELEQQLADRYAEIFACFRRNSDKISGVTLWGVADDHTWLHKMSAGRPLPAPRTNYPLLFDYKEEPKKAYFAVRDLSDK